jgi:putative transposase
MCQIGEISRAGYYRQWRRNKPREEEIVLRDRLQEVVLANRHYGYRRIGASLRREGWHVNNKRVLRIMREDNLLCLRRRAFVPITTDSKHSWRVWPNLTRGIETTGLNQLWVADITYVRLKKEFVFVAVVLDAHSRRVVGWAIEQDLSATLALQALKMALVERIPAPGMIHHSDRGVQYACSDYVEALEKHGIQISMSRVGNPYDNAKAESFMKTLKQEEVNGCEYRDANHLRRSITEFVENVYNQKRLHSALGYQSPNEFEAELLSTGISIGLRGGKVLWPPSPTPPTPIQLLQESVPVFSVSP